MSVHKKNKNAGRLVFIKWEDSASSANAQPWIGLEDVPHKTVKVETIGWIVRETKKKVTVSSSVVVSGGTQVAGIMTILKSTILHREYIDWKSDE